MAQSIEELMRELGGMNYHVPSSFKLPNFTYNAPKMTSLNLSPWNFTQSDFKDLSSSTKKGSKGLGSVNLWDVLSGTLGQTSGLVTNSLYNTIRDIKDPKKGLLEKIFDVAIKDNIGGSLAQGLVNGGKEQWKDWTDGKASWGDIPLVGLLHGMDKGWKRGEDIVHDELGVNNKWGKVGGGIGLDILLDPLTYLTGGLSAASKLGKAAELAKTAELAKGLGLTRKFKNADEFISTAEHAIKSDLITRYTDKAGKLTVSPSLIDKTVAKKVGALSDEIKTARNTTYNAHVNTWGFAAPFSNKVLKVGKYGSKNLLHNSEAMAPKELVDGLLKEIANGNSTHAKQLENFVKARYGVGHTGELSKTMFDDLHNVLNPFRSSKVRGLPDVSVVSKVVDHLLPHADFTRLMDEVKSAHVPWKDVQKQLDNFIDVIGHDPQLRSTVGKHLAEKISKYWETKPVKNFSKVANQRKAASMKWVSKFLGDSKTYQKVENAVKDIHPHGDPAKLANLHDKEFYRNLADAGKSKYNEMGDFKTNIEHFIDKKSPFNARSLATKDKFVNSMGEHIADASSQRIGETARYSRSMDKIEKYIKNYTGDKAQLMEHAIYVLENHAPDALGGKNWIPSREANKLANLIRPVIDRIGSQEQGAGILDKLRSNYFPHVLNKNMDEHTLSEIQDYMKRNDMKGLKGTSKFNNERKTFQTLAQKDNYIAKLEKAIQKETDSGTIESLRAQQERVAKMFDTDVVSALQRRIKEGVRAKAMNELQGKLGKYNMMKSMHYGDKGDVPSGLKELTPEEAKKLGLKTKDSHDKSIRHFIHPDVLEGMKKVDDIFTNEGMNKFVRHMTAIADIWRPLVTYYKPSHYVNNIIGNTINNLAAGVKYGDYKVAGKLIKGYRNGKLTEDQMKIMEAAYKHNVISGGFLYDAKPTYHFSESGKLEKVAEKLTENKPIKAIRRVGGEMPDDIARLANFINGMNKYGSVAKAAKQVRTYLFNYNELTNADRTMRVLVPFWNWTKRNVPLQMKLLLTNPKFALNNGRALQFFNQHEKGADWQKQSGVHVPKTVTDLLGSKNEYYKNIPSPVMDLNQVLNPSEMLGSMTPVAKMPIELSMNKKFFTGAPISYGSQNVQPADLLAYLASNTGIGGNIFDFLSGKKGGGESLINLLGSVSKVNSKAAPSN